MTTKKQQTQEWTPKKIAIITACGIAVFALFGGLIAWANATKPVSSEALQDEFIQNNQKIVEVIQKQKPLFDDYFTCKNLQDNYRKNTTSIDCDKVMAEYESFKAEEQALDTRNAELLQECNSRGGC